MLEALFKRKNIRDFLKGYSSELYKDVIPDVFEIGVLALERSFEKSLYTKEEFDEIIEDLLNSDYFGLKKKRKIKQLGPEKIKKLKEIKPKYTKYNLEEMHNPKGGSYSNFLNYVGDEQFEEERKVDGSIWPWGVEDRADVDYENELGDLKKRIGYKDPRNPNPYGVTQNPNAGRSNYPPGKPNSRTQSAYPPGTGYPNYPMGNSQRFPNTAYPSNGYGYEYGPSGYPNQYPGGYPYAYPGGNPYATAGPMRVNPLTLPGSQNKTGNEKPLNDMNYLIDYDKQTFDPKDIKKIPRKAQRIEYHYNEDDSNRNANRNPQQNRRREQPRRQAPPPREPSHHSQSQASIQEINPDNQDDEDNKNKKIKNAKSEDEEEEEEHEEHEEQENNNDNNDNNDADGEEYNEYGDNNHEETQTHTNEDEDPEMEGNEPNNANSDMDVGPENQDQNLSDFDYDDDLNAVDNKNVRNSQVTPDGGH